MTEEVRMTPPDAPRADAADGVTPDRSLLEWAAQCIEWRADKYEFGAKPMPNTARELRKEAEAVRLAAAVVAAAVAWLHLEGSTGDVMRAVDAYEAASGGRG